MLVCVVIAMYKYLLYTMCVHAYMYRGCALQQPIHMMLICYAIYTKLGMLVYLCMFSMTSMPITYLFL